MDPGSATHTLLAQLPALICKPHPESALVLPCTEPDPALPALSLIVLFGCPCLDKSLKIPVRTDTLLKILIPPTPVYFVHALRRVSVTSQYVMTQF